MRRVVLYLTIGVMFLVTSHFLLRELSPFNLNKIEELIQSNEIKDNDFEALNSEISNLINRGLIFPYLSENAYVVGFCILAGIFCIFVGIHLIIDKIFFKNFYEPPNHFNSIRRGTLLILCLICLLFAKLNGNENYILVLIILITFLLELIYILYFKSKKTEIEEIENSEIFIENVDGKHISYEETIEDLDRFGTSSFTEESIKDKNI